MTVTCPKCGELGYVSWTYGGGRNGARYYYVVHRDKRRCWIGRLDGYTYVTRALFDDKVKAGVLKGPEPRRAAATYAQMAVEMLEAALIEADRGNGEVPVHIVERLRRLIERLGALSLPPPTTSQICEVEGYRRCDETPCTLAERVGRQRCPYNLRGLCLASPITASQICDGGSGDG